MTFQLLPSECCGAYGAYGVRCQVWLEGQETCAARVNEGGCGLQRPQRVGMITMSIKLKLSWKRPWEAFKLLAVCVANPLAPG